MKNYTCQEDIKNDIKILELKRNIAIETLKLKKHRLAHKMSIVHWLPSTIKKLTEVRWSELLIQLLRKNS